MTHQGPQDATLLILAGGRSRRMGRPKALLPVAEVTLIEWVVDRLAPGFPRLLIAARDPAQVPARLRSHVVLDLRPGAGPLAGIEAGLRAASGGALVAVACDMPAVDRALARRLLAALAGHDAAVPRLVGRPEPACAAYAASALAGIAEALDAGRGGAAAALDGLRVRWLDGEEPAQFANLNTPEDYRAFLDALRYENRG